MAQINSVFARDVVMMQTKSGLDANAFGELKWGLKGLNNLKVVKYAPGQLEKTLLTLNGNDRVISLADNPATVLEGFRAREDETPRRIIFGAYSESFEGPGVSLRVDPNKMFESLKEISPLTRVLKTVVTKDYDKGHLRVIEEAARQNDIEFSFEFVETPQETAAAWSEALQAHDSETTAIILIDTKFMKQIKGLQHILKSAWESKSLVLTTVRSYSGRGVSMGVAFDLKGYGKELATYLALDGEEEIFSRSYFPVINVRHIKHSGRSIKIDSLKTKVVFFE